MCIFVSDLSCMIYFIDRFLSINISSQPSIQLLYFIFLRASYQSNQPQKIVLQIYIQFKHILVLLHCCCVRKRAISYWLQHYDGWSLLIRYKFLISSSSNIMLLKYFSENLFHNIKINIPLENNPVEIFLVFTYVLLYPYLQFDHQTIVTVH